MIETREAEVAALVEKHGTTRIRNAVHQLGAEKVRRARYILQTGALHGRKPHIAELNEVMALLTAAIPLIEA